MLDQGFQLCVGNVHDVVWAYRAFGVPRRLAEVTDVVAILAHSEGPPMNDVRVHTRGEAVWPISISRRTKGGCLDSIL